MRRSTSLILLLLLLHAFHEGSEWDNMLQKLTQKKIFCRGVSSQSFGGFWRSEGSALVKTMLANELFQQKSDKQLVKAVGSQK